MNVDRRIVPEKHVSSLLAEDHIGERTVEIKNTLKVSQNKLHSVAHKWIEYDGMNSLARVMLKNVEKVPQKNHSSIKRESRHEAHHGHEGHAGLASFVHTGHWFGDRGAWVFGMVGRYLGELLGYTFKLLAVLLIFGPTRTAIIAALIIGILNIWTGTALSVWLSAGACLILHGVFSLTTKMSGGDGHGSGHGGGHGHENHGHH